MTHIAIIAASVRTNRVSNRVALYLQQHLNQQGTATAEILDLNTYKFPVFDERFAYQSNPSREVVDFREKIMKADGVIIVTPEYNGGYPASLKNVIDLLYQEWHRKPIAVAAVSDGNFGGTQVITSLLFTLWKIRAWVVSPAFHVPNAQQAFDEQGKPKDEAATARRVGAVLKELFWAIDAKKKMEQP